MKQPNPQRWAEYMRECAERCRRQLAAAQVRAGAKAAGVTFMYSGTAHGTWVGPPMAHDPYRLPRAGARSGIVGTTITHVLTDELELPGHERPLDWFADAVRKGCTDE